jgi:hypothetical protein
MASRALRLHSSVCPLVAMTKKWTATPWKVHQDTLVPVAGCTGPSLHLWSVFRDHMAVMTVCLCVCVCVCVCARARA